MKVTIDLENLEGLVQETIENNIESVIKEQVSKRISSIVEQLAKKEVENKVSENFQRFVDEYIQTTTIKTGGRSYWDDEPEKEYTVEQYIKKELKDKLESKTLKVKKSGGYSDSYENVSFEDYIKRSFNAEEIIKKDLDKFMDGVRQDINKTMKETFDSSTRNMLSSSVLSILTATDTYRQIENNIKCIADKRS